MLFVFWKEENYIKSKDLLISNNFYCENPLRAFLVKERNRNLQFKKGGMGKAQISFHLQTIIFIVRTFRVSLFQYLCLYFPKLILDCIF